MEWHGEGEVGSQEEGVGWSAMWKGKTEGRWVQERGFGRRWQQESSGEWGLGRELGRWVRWALGQNPTRSGVLEGWRVELGMDLAPSRGVRLLSREG